MVKPYQLKDYNTMEKWNAPVPRRSQTPYYFNQTFRGFRTGRPDQRSRRRATPYAIKSASKFKDRFKNTASLETWLCRLGRVIVTLTCAASCMYFLINFFLLYWEYQTVVNVTIEFPEKPDLPGVTVCVENLKKLPQCENGNPKVHASLCHDIEKIVTNTKSKAFKEFLALRTIEDIKSMAPTLKELFLRCKLATEVDDRPTEICNKSLWLYYKGSNCYSMWTRWYSKPKYNTLKANDSELHIILGYDPDEYYNTEKPMIADVYVHGRKGLPDSRTASFEANPGEIANIGVTISSVRLLEPPYKTMCKYYGNGIKMNNKTVYSEDLCVLECSKTQAMEWCNCIPNCLQLTEPKDKCVQDIQWHRQCCSYVISSRRECHKTCPSDCYTMLYDVSLDVDKGYDFDPLRHELNDSSYNNTLFSKIAINLQAVRHIHYVHGAKITPIEILGYVGGYLGIWLGVSIPWIYDNMIKGLKYLKIIPKKINRRKSSTISRSISNSKFVK